MAEPATESPMETRMRMTLVLAGLPRPQAQVALHDAQGLFLGRADLYYPAQRLILEYDGATHRTSLVEDDRRQNRLLNAGHHLLRFTFADINGTPDAVIAQVRRALGLNPTQRTVQRRNARYMPPLSESSKQDFDPTPRLSNSTPSKAGSHQS